MAKDMSTKLHLPFEEVSLGQIAHKALFSEFPENCLHMLSVRCDELVLVLPFGRDYHVVHKGERKVELLQNPLHHALESRVAVLCAHWHNTPLK